ncbi:hypothetical protein MASR2M70_08590 [Bacillota bacterium]
MKGLWITIAATLFLLVVWGWFISSSESDVRSMTENIRKAESSIHLDNWQESREAIEDISRRWINRRLVFSLFFDAISIEEFESSIKRAAAYCFAEEKGPALAELAYLRHYLLFLFENETISVENIL